MKAFVKVDAPIVALTHVRVIDGTGAAAREDQTIILSKGRIESVADAASANVPKDAQVLDLHGYSVIPGLVGMHDHMFYPAGGNIFHEMPVSFPRLYLAGGVTTIRTAGSIEPYMDLALAKAIERGEVPGPHVHVTGPYLEGPGSWAPQMMALQTPEETRGNSEFLGGPRSGQFQSLQLLDTGRTEGGDWRGTQARTEGDGASLLDRFPGGRGAWH